jgi:hypothetical protein
MGLKPTARDNVTSISSKEGPTLASVAPEWVRLTNLLLNLNARRDELIAKVGPLNNEVSRSGWSYFYEHSRTPQEPAQPITASPGAAELLGPEFTPTPKMPEVSGIRVPSWVVELRKISDEIKSIDEALALLHPQLTKARADGSRRLWKMLQPEYRGIAGRVCAALIELGQAHLEHESFIERHVSAERASLRPIHGTGTLGDPRDPQSELRRLLQWAAECGHFPPETLPKEWAKGATGAIYGWPPATPFDQP